MFGKMRKSLLVLTLTGVFMSGNCYSGSKIMRGELHIDSKVLKYSVTLAKQPSSTETILSLIFNLDPQQQKFKAFTYQVSDNPWISSQKLQDQFLTEVSQKVNKSDGNLPGVLYLEELSEKLASIFVKQVEDLRDSMIDLISDGVGIKAIFPQQKEDLGEIDDGKRNDFILLAGWILKVIEPGMVSMLKDKILKLDDNFITLVNNEWGEDIYTSCRKDLDTPLASYEIPSSVLDGCTVETILSTSPDFFPSDADNGFKKLIPIIKIVSPYVSEVARESLDSLKGSIRAAMEKYTPQAIATTLADHSKEEIQSSVEHFDSWVVLAGTL